MGYCILDDNCNPISIIYIRFIQGYIMVKIKIEDIIFWIFIAITVGTALWLLHGSPPESSAIITVAITFAGSELLLWRKIFSIEKRTTIGFIKINHEMNNNFMKMKNEMDKNNLMINNKLDNYHILANNKLDNLNNKLNLIKKR